jgi:hypothetical protein
MTPASRAFVKKSDIKVQVIGHRNREEEQHESAGKRGPFAKRIALHQVLLARPSRSPQTEQAKSDEEPEDVEEQFHSAFLWAPARFSAGRPHPFSIYYALQSAATNCSWFVLGGNLDDIGRHLLHLSVNAPIRSQDFAVARTILPAGKIGDPSARFLHEQHARCRVP